LEIIATTQQARVVSLTNGVAPMQRICL